MQKQVVEIMKDIRNSQIQRDALNLQKENSPPVVILDEPSEDEFEYAKTMAEGLRIKILQVKGKNKIAVINNKDIALKLARELKKKSQYLFYDLEKRLAANFAMYAISGYTLS